MAGKKGERNIDGMKHRRKGGQDQPESDGFDRSHSSTLASLIDGWNQRLAERNYSERTLEAHKWALRTFLTWAHERDLTDPKDITKPILESFQGWLYRYRKADGKPLAIGTQRARLGALQRFFAHLCKENHLPANPAADLELPRKQQRRLPKGLSKEELADLMAAPDVRDPLGIRDRAILETFYATGARRSELTGLDLSDLDQSTQTLLIRKGKGDKDRLLPIGKTTLHWLVTYLEKAAPNSSCKLVSKPSSCPVTARESAPATWVIGLPKPSNKSASKSPEAAISSATAAPPTCTKTAQISGSSNNSSATRDSTPPASTLKSPSRT